MKEVLYMIAPRGVPDCTSTASHSDDGTAEQPLGGSQIESLPVVYCQWLLQMPLYKSTNATKQPIWKQI